MKDTYGFERLKLDSVNIEELIVVRLTRGEGTPEDVVRRVVQIWSFDGEMIAESDPIAELTSVMEEESNNGTSSKGAAERGMGIP